MKTTVADCSASGSFAVTLGAGDAGSSNLTGTFSSEYCTRR
jgi:hypothetical protein